jgi:hypothetical protein
VVRVVKPVEPTEMLKIALLKLAPQQAKKNKYKKIYSVSIRLNFITEIFNKKNFYFRKKWNGSKWGVTTITSR